jgi:hypothetical protein
MRNIKVIQHIHGKEHITIKLQSKSLEFTYEFIGNFWRKDIAYLTANRHELITDTINAIYLTYLKTQYLRTGILKYSQNLKYAFLLAKT